MLRKYTLLLLILWQWPASFIATAQSLDSELAQIVSDYQLMGMSVVKVCDGQISFSEGYGLADYDDNIPVTQNTLYRIASVSKSVTATALMILYDQGLFDLDDDINTCLGYSIRNWHYPDDPITFRMLLSHTSSIVDGSKYSNFLSATYSQNPPPSISAYFVPGGTYYTGNIFLNRKPGTYFSYSNSNFGLIGTLIEKLSGMRFDDFCRLHIFDPLEINASFNIQDIADISDVAVLYRYIGNNWVPQADNYNGVMPPPLDLSQYTIGDNGFLFGPQGGLRISAEGLAAFMLLHANDGAYNNAVILQNSTAQLMHAVQWQYNGSNGNDYYGLFKAWGLGFHITTNAASSDLVFPDRKMTGHPGEAYGLISDMYFDSLQNGVIFITNGSKLSYVVGPSSSFYTVEADVFGAVYDDLQNCTVAEDPKQIQDFEIVPNPAINWITVQSFIHGGLHYMDQVSIYDHYGRLWYSAPAASVSMEVAALPPGIYRLCFKVQGHPYQVPFIRQ